MHPAAKQDRFAKLFVEDIRFGQSMGRVKVAGIMLKVRFTISNQPPVVLALVKCVRIFPVFEISHCGIRAERRRSPTQRLCGQHSRFVRGLLCCRIHGQHSAAKNILSGAGEIVTSDRGSCEYACRDDSRGRALAFVLCCGKRACRPHPVTIRQMRL